MFSICGVFRRMKRLMRQRNNGTHFLAFMHLFPKDLRRIARLLDYYPIFSGNQYRAPDHQYFHGFWTLMLETDDSYETLVAGESVVPQFLFCVLILRFEPLRFYQSTLIMKAVGCNLIYNVILFKYVRCVVDRNVQ
eukprot:c18480_g1_i1 orf=28-435(-)